MGQGFGRQSRTALLFLAGFSFCLVSWAADQSSQTAPSGSGVSYPIRSGDKLNIQVYRDKELSAIYPVDDEGRINFPLLGNLQVKGLTTEQVRELLTEKLGQDYLVDPQIQVDFEKSVVKNVMVSGQVMKPGNYDFTPDLTVLKLVLNAGGFGPSASLGKVRILRTEQDGTKQSIQVNMKRVLDGRDEDMELQPGDLVVVPESLF